MSAYLFALALLLQDAPEAAPAVEPAPAELPYPVGAPREDYQLVAWCYGALSGYLNLHDVVMPEVTRIETTYRRPGSNLAEDLKVYADMQAEGRRNMALFQRAMTAAEKASLRPINAAGGAAINRGRSVWAAAATVPKARLAQEWMSWSLPIRCTPTAEALEKRALLAGASLQVNVEPDPAPEAMQEQAALPPLEAAPGSPVENEDSAPLTVDDLLAPPLPEAETTAPTEAEPSDGAF